MKMETNFICIFKMFYKRKNFFLVNVFIKYLVILLILVCNKFNIFYDVVMEIE